MLASFKRWFARDPAAARWAEIDAWAKAAGHRFARAREGEGFVVDAAASGVATQRPWRLEWGPPQRAYITGQELRIRIELGLPSSLQMLLMSRALMESLESEIFERSTQDLQTHVDMSTPEEMRWLSMFAKSPLTQRALRPHFGGVSNGPALLAGWVEGALAECLEAAAATMLKAGPPFLLMTLRGRLYLRLQLAEVDPPTVAQAVDIFDAAIASATLIATGLRQDAEAAWPSSGATAWQNQYPPDA